MDKPQNPIEYNREAWNHQVRSGNRWTKPYSDEIINNARAGKWEVVLTPFKPVPSEWFPAAGAKLLGLASAGGQQCPVFAAAGFDVTVFDNSPEQLKQDEIMAKKHHLQIKTVQGDMADLSVFENETFDVVFNPCSTGFVPDVIPVYKEVSRVLKKGGIFMTGFTNPVYFLFDVRLAEEGIFRLKYHSPYSDLKSLSHDELSHFLRQHEPIVYGHSLEAHINGQLNAGLNLTAIYEDIWGNNNLVDRFFPAFVASRAVKSL